jgi:hypothetical protein
MASVRVGGGQVGRRSLFNGGSALALAIVCLTASLVSQSLYAQERQPAPVQADKIPLELVRPPLPIGQSSDEPAPDWMVWRAFYTSLEFYGSSATVVQELLFERSGLTPSEVSAVLAAGHDYLGELARVDAETRAQVSARFRQATPASTSPRPPLPPLPSRGRTIEEVLATEGFIARVEEQRSAVFRKHWEALAATIGLAKLVALERFITADVSPKVHVARQGMPVTSNKEQIVPR